METLRLSTSQEQPLEASKWLSCHLLVDTDEMTSLLDSLEPFSFFLCGTVLKDDEGEIPRSIFLQGYHNYIEALKEGSLPTGYQQLFSCAMTRSADTLYALPLADDKRLIRIAKPVVQLQPNTIDYSPIDKKFRSNVFGSNSIPWGIQFSYPQIYQDHQTKEVIQTKDSTLHPNTTLFHAIQKWVRKATVPTPFFVDETLIRVPFRLGKGCFTWINRHPRLIEKSIKVKEATNERD